MATFEWKNIFEVSDDWEVYVHYKGADTSADSYSQYVRSDLLNPDVIVVTIVSGEIVITVLDEPDTSAAGLPLPAVVVRNSAGLYYRIRGQVTQNDEDLCPYWMSAVQQNVNLITGSPGYLNVEGGSTAASYDYADIDDMASMHEWPQRPSNAAPHLRIAQVGDKEPTLPATATVAVGHAVTPFVTVYEFSPVTGFGTKYSNPASLPVFNGYDVDFHPDGDVLLVTSFANTSTQKGLYAYAWSPAGFGTKYSDPALPSMSGSHFTGGKFTPDGDAIVVCAGATTTPTVFGYPWSVGSGFGTRFADPSSTPTDSGGGVAVSPDGTVVAAGFVSTPALKAWLFNSASGFSTKYTDAASSLGSSREVKFSPSGAGIVAVSAATGPYVKGYPWNNTTGFGAAYSNPGTAPGNSLTGGQPYSLDFTPSGGALAISSGSAFTRWLTIYHWSDSTGFGSIYTNLATAQASDKRGVKFTPDGSALLISDASSPFIHAYAWDDTTGIGAKFSNPATLPAGGGYRIAALPGT